MRIRTQFLAALVLVLLSANTDAELIYSIHDLGVQGREALGARINNQGHVLFGLQAASPGALSARFFFDGQSSTDVTSIFDSGPGFNDAGTLVGVRSGNGVAVDVFRFTVGDLSGPPNAVLGQLQGLGSRVFASNNNGAHAGAEGSINGYRAIVFNEPNQVTQLGTLGGDTSIAQAINDSGDVVGVSKTGATLEQIVAGASSEEAFLYHNGILVGLGTLGGRTSAARYQRAWSSCWRIFAR